MESVINHKGLAYKLTVGVAMLGVLAGALAVAASGAFAQNNKGPDGPEEVYALTTNDKLLKFDGDKPEKAKKMKITGLASGESLVGIDFRPSSQVPSQQGVLYAVSDQSFIYTIDPDTAVATRGPQITANGAPVALRGTSFGIDFNPTVDRLRIISDANQNLRVNVDTGALADFDPNTPGTQPDMDLAYAAGDPNAGTDPAATATAYRNSQPSAFGTGPIGTEQYDIETVADVMVEQTPPNNGTLVTEGSLGVDAKLIAGFDITTVGASPAGDRGFVALKVKKKSKFYAIDLENGDVTKIGKIGDNRRGQKVEGLAIPIAETLVT